MQPNATRPVMDVARRSPSPVVPRTPVRQAPPLKQPAVRQPIAQSKQPEVKKTSQMKPQIPTQTKASAPVGIIVMSLLIMMVLIGLAITIYLTSQI